MAFPPRPTGPRPSPLSVPTVAAPNPNGRDYRALRLAAVPGVLGGVFYALFSLYHYLDPGPSAAEPRASSPTLPASAPPVETSPPPTPRLSLDNESWMIEAEAEMRSALDRAGLSAEGIPAIATALATAQRERQAGRTDAAFTALRNARELAASELQFVNLKAELAQNGRPMSPSDVASAESLRAKGEYDAAMSMLRASQPPERRDFRVPTPRR